MMLHNSLPSATWRKNEEQGRALKASCAYLVLLSLW